VSQQNVTVIQPTTGWKRIDLKELFEFKDLIYYLSLREIKVLYAQTILGLSWAIIQPLVQIVLFTIIFGKIAKVPSEGIPYVLFSTVALVPWTYMSMAMQQSSLSLVNNQAMLGKLYFPRLIYPLVPILARFLDFLISIIIILPVAYHFQIRPTWNLLLFPFLVLMMMSISAGIGLWMSALAIRYRDVRHAMTFILRLLMYSAPIVYSAANIESKYRIFYSMNPIVGVIEGFRACLLGTPAPWQFIWPGVISTILLFAFGIMYFKKTERIFVDVI
jgi:lipopolysaccharide transport system permease protein